MPINPVCWFEIYVNDMARARAFYQAVLGLELSPLASPDAESVEMWAFPMLMDRPGSSGALAKMEGMKPGGNSVLVYFSCEDCAVEAGRIVKAGGKVERDKFSIGDYGHIALAYDTEGNLFGLHSMK